MAKGKQMAAKSYLILNLNYSNKKKKLLEYCLAHSGKDFTRPQTRCESKTNIF